MACPSHDGQRFPVWHSRPCSFLTLLSLNLTFLICPGPVILLCRELVGWQLCPQDHGGPSGPAWVTSARAPVQDPGPGGCAYSHMGFSCPISSSFVHFAHSFLSVLMEQRMGPQGLPQSSMAGTLR